MADEPAIQYVAKPDTWVRIIAGAALTMAAFALVWMFNSNATMAVMSRDLEALVADTEADKKRDVQLIKHWKLHHWAKDQITVLRAEAHGLPVVSWPDLD